MWTVQCKSFIIIFLTLQEHLNFICDDEKLGPVILSVKQEIEKLDGCDTQGFIRVILRYIEPFVSRVIDCHVVHILNF